jgi:hypothetical protein
MNKLEARLAAAKENLEWQRENSARHKKRIQRATAKLFKLVEHKIWVENDLAQAIGEYESAERALKSAGRAA